MAGPKKKKTKKKAAKKRSPKKTAKKKTAAKKSPKTSRKKKTPAKAKKKALKRIVIGKVTHYFPHVNAAVVKIVKPLTVGDTVQVLGHTTNFTQRVQSMQIDHTPIQKAKKGDEIGLQVKERVREHDQLVLPK